MSGGYVLVRLKRPEGYEDVHPELILQDAGINPAFEPELVARGEHEWPDFAAHYDASAGPRIEVITATHQEAQRLFDLLAARGEGEPASGVAEAQPQQQKGGA